MNNVVKTQSFSLLILMMTLICIPQKSLANSSYIGIDYAYTDLDISNENANPSMAALRIGTSIHHNISVEGQYLLPISTDSIYRMDFDLEQSKRIYLLLQSDIVSGFGLDISLGYAVTDLAVTGPENTYNGTDQYNDFSWGLSIHQQIPYLENAHIKLGYLHLYKDSNIKIAELSLGISYYF